MGFYDKFEDVEALDSLGVWYKCEVVEVKDRDHYLVTFTSWPSTYDRIIGKEEIRCITASGKQKHGPSAELQVIFQNLWSRPFSCLQTKCFI